MILLRTCMLSLALALLPLSCLGQPSSESTNGKKTLAVDANGRVGGSRHAAERGTPQHASDLEAPGPAGDCPYQGVFASTTCARLNAVFSTPPSVTGSGIRDMTSWLATVYGPGVNNGGYNGWSVAHMLSYELDSSQRGIKQGMFTNLNCHEAGDCIDHYSYVNSDMGSVAGGDEGTGNLDMDLEENRGQYKGRVPAGTSQVGLTQIDPVFLSGDNWTTDGGYLINGTRSVIHAALSGPSAPVAASVIPYLHTAMVNALPLTRAALPVTSTWATAFAPDSKTFTASVAQTNVPATSSAAVTFRVTVQPVAGVYRPIPSSGLVCVASDIMPEQAYLAGAGAMNPTTHVQEVTLNVRNPHLSVALFVGGPCGRYFSFDADFNSTGMRQVYPIVGSLTGSDAIYQTVSFGSTLHYQLPVGNGGSLATTDGGPDAAISIFEGAEVVANRAPAGAHPTLEPNNVDFESGDVLEGLHSPHVGFKQLGMQAIINTPCATNGDCNVIQARAQGTGIVGPTALFDFENQQPDSWYKAGGGRWTPPFLFSILGPNQGVFHVYQAPQNGGAVIFVQNPANRTADFNLFDFGFKMSNIQAHMRTGRLSTEFFDISQSRIGELEAGSLRLDHPGTPVSGQTCTQGQMLYDATRLYLCTGTTWSYVALSPL